MKRTLFFSLLLCLSISVSAQRETRNLDAFNKIRLEGAGKIYLIQGDTHEVVVDLDDRDYELADIKTEVNGNTLVIDYKSKGWLDNAPDVDLWITYSRLEEIVTDGASSIETENILRGDRLRLECNGAQKATMDIEVDELVASISGAGSFNLSGTANYAKISVDGAGKIDGEDLRCRDVVASVDGVGSITIYASESIDGNVSGVGKIRFAGNPKTQKLNSDGIGSVKPMN